MDASSAILPTYYDYELVAWSIVIAVAGAYAAFDLNDRTAAILQNSILISNADGSGQRVLLHDPKRMYSLRPGRLGETRLPSASVGSFIPCVARRRRNRRDEY